MDRISSRDASASKNTVQYRYSTVAVMDAVLCYLATELLDQAQLQGGRLLNSTPHSWIGEGCKQKEIQGAQKIGAEMENSGWNHGYEFKNILVQ